MSIALRGTLAAMCFMLACTEHHAMKGSGGTGDAEPPAANGGRGGDGAAGHSAADGGGTHDAAMSTDQDSGTSRDAGVISIDDDAGFTPAEEACLPGAGAAVCGQELCGNGEVDRVTPSGSYCYESCDGANLDGKDCSALGYRGGRLLCGSWCGYEISHCESCGDDPRIRACAHPNHVPTRTYDWLAMATKNADELAIARVGGQHGSLDTKVIFTRFDRNLARISETACLGPQEPRALALARTPRAWILYALGATETNDLYRLDDGGNIVSARKLAGGSVSLVTFSDLTNDGSLLAIWNDSVDDPNHLPRTLMGELLDADGNNIGGPWKLADQLSSTSGHDARFVGDGFLVAAPLFADVDHQSLLIVHVSLDGTVTMGADLPGQQLDGASLAWNGSEARLLYNTFTKFGVSSAPSLQWQRLDRAGNAVGSLELFESGLQGGIMYGSYPLLPLGANTAVLRARGGTSTDRIQLMVVDPDGATVTAPFDVNLDRSAPLFAFSKLGDDLVVAWVGALGYEDSQTLNLVRIAL